MRQEPQDDRRHERGDHRAQRRKARRDYDGEPDGDKGKSENPRETEEHPEERCDALASAEAKPRRVTMTEYCKQRVRRAEVDHRPASDKVEPFKPRGTR